MKIALPVEGNSVESSVCQNFGRAPYFLIHNTLSKENEFIDNAAVTTQGGAGIKAAQTIVDHQADALITPRCGENAAKVMNGANIIIYKTINDTINENIDAFYRGKLALLQDIHAGFHNHGK
ncbi:MAG: NifB/NifX family molybdenum-iron cluster-binding protein [Eubacteriales bacterium]